jgi:hypothetical protein
MYGALRAPTSNYVVRPAQGAAGARTYTNTGPRLIFAYVLAPAAADAIFTNERRTEDGGGEHNWYSRGLDMGILGRASCKYTVFSEWLVHVMIHPWLASLGFDVFARH